MFYFYFFEFILYAIKKKFRITNVEPAAIEISDDESVMMETMCEIPNKKRPLPMLDTHQESKYFKTNDENANGIKTVSSLAVNETIKKH